jgi:hypothetical protein
MKENQNNKLKKAPKRFSYPLMACFEMDTTRHPIQIQNISKTGVQFFSNVTIPKNVQIRLMWQDPKYGEMQSYLMVVREISQPDQTPFSHCYGSKFVNLKNEAQKNLNRVVEITSDHELKTYEKILDKVSFKEVNDLLVAGRNFLRDIIKGRRSSFQMIEQFVQELKEYEKKSFYAEDETSHWIQKFSTQHFHCRVLMVLLSTTGMRNPRIHDIKKMVNDKLQSIHCLLQECEEATKTKTSPELKESMSRLAYSRIELSETLAKHACSILG